MLDGLIASLNQIDILIFYIININMQNQVFDVIMPLISSVGYFSIWIGLCVLLYVFGGRKGRNVALVCIVALVFGYFLTEILKYIVARPRPYVALNGIRVLTDMSGSSWPSGHTVASFIGAIIIGRSYSFKFKGKRCRLIYPLLVFAFLVGFSRIYNGVHYPFDVISGALIGIFCALLILMIEKDIIKFNEMLL
ncbi:MULTISPECIES: phosphatase PAP2 family protein [Methanobacterium]|uniref:Phosphoesterase PA-phosphatase n=1 Tax=Methanobacterium bryantii TaxID=2161 RepID=A0A2A2H9U6_METBR|nr:MULTISPECIES: phosphatase PAP2 family protein [Methanobacterium]OEC87103.1 phosphoesterase PA-phosphatase [Methanobacterium sp. A39]PAV06168.1 phosphoesterase PA-phosphatase [Methanobacterium bryantii]